MSRTENALRASGANADGADFLRDVVHVTGLLLEEGGHYDFIHKSVAEYHAAVCIYSDNSPNGLAEKFYSRVREDPDSGELWGVVSFLREIDSDSFVSLHWLPLLLDISTAVPLGHTHSPPTGPPARTSEVPLQVMEKARLMIPKRFGLLRQSFPPSERAFFESTQHLFDGGVGNEALAGFASRSGHEHVLANWWKELGEAIQRAWSLTARVKQRTKFLGI